MPSLTVIMPAFQASATIERAIASVVAQTFTDWELIVVDDASTDETAAMAERCAARDPRIRVIRLERNQGAAAAMNRGWQSTRAPFVAIHDADDESLPGRLTAQLTFMQSHPEVHVLGGGAQFVDEAGRTLAWVRHPMEHAELAPRRWRQSPFVHSTVVMRREFLTATGGYPAGMRLAEDYDLWMRGFAAGLFRYHNLGEILVVYRTRPVQRWKMIRASAGARIKAGRREHRPMTGWAAAAWILFNGGLEQSRIFVLRDALKNFGPKPSAPLRAGPPLDPRPLHVVLVTSSLGGGGAERVLATMANHWAGLGWEVTVLTLRADEATTAYPLHERVRVGRLNLIRERNPVLDAGHLGRLLALRRALRAAAPDLVISFLDKLNVAVLLAVVGTGIRVIATEHLVPWRQPMGAVWETLRRLVYRRAARIVSPTAGIRDYLVRSVPGRHTILGYPAQLLPGAALPVTDRAPLIFAAGRLAPEKGFDVLIAAFARVHAQHPAWRLEIAGEGPLRSALAAQISASGLGGSVELRGHLPTVRERMRDAAIFVLSSRNEAYPMVVCEAMAAGAAVVATDCPTGPREMLRAGVDGLLVPPDDVPALAEALLGLIANAALREKLAAAAHVGARRFGIETVMPQWDGLVRQVMAESR